MLAAARDCYFNLSYPFWHDKRLRIVRSEMTSACRAALWYSEDIEITDTSAQSEYFMMRSDHLYFDKVRLKGKYSFQYIADSVFTGCEFDTKDAFWHAKNVVVKDSVIKGEYLAWYCENVTFENCTIIGTQPLCYCKGLKLINCRMVDCDLAFEKSDVIEKATSGVVCGQMWNNHHLSTNYPRGRFLHTIIQL